MIKAISSAKRRSRVSVVFRILPDAAQFWHMVSTDALRELTQQTKSQSEYSSLLNAVAQLNAAIATAPSDKLYSLLEMTGDGKDLMPKPNYKIFAEVCIMTTTATKADSADLGITGYGKATLGSTLPSWVLKLTRGMPSFTMTWYNTGRHDFHNATGITSKWQVCQDGSDDGFS